MNREQQRFQAAVAAMRGLLSVPPSEERGERAKRLMQMLGITSAHELTAYLAVESADALLSQLDRTKPEPETPQPDADGWIPHRPGDPCPCEPTDMVYVKLKDGSEWSTPDRAGFWMGDDEYSDSWRAVYSDSAIVAWKPA